MPTSRDGIILFAHGSRDPLWHRPMEAVAARIAELDTQTPVRCAYLELTPPDLPACAAALVAEGVSRITILPLFLGVGKHAREDLPQLLAGLKSAHPGVTFSLQPAIGEDPRVVDLLARMALGRN
jgi:sirohydrochlorin cobaltochelatase